MKKTILLLLVLTIFSCTKKNEISYKVSHAVNDSFPAVNIEMTFKANKSGETILLISDDAWGEKNLYNTISNLKSKQVTEIIKVKDSGWIVLKHKKSVTDIKLKYTLTQDFEGVLVSDKFYRPVIQESYFHILSHSMFMIPKGYAIDSTSKFDVSIEWENYNKDFTIVNSFGSNIKQQEIKNTSKEVFESAIFTGGDYRVIEFDINSNKVVFSIRGEWETITDSEIAGYIKKTIQIQRDFWDDHTQEYFSVIVTPTFLKEGSGLRGTSITNSFATGISNNKFLKTDELVKLFNHELMHNWIGGVIEYESGDQYWFSEGFTEYYSLKNIAKNKISGLDESYFIQQLNFNMKALFVSSAKEVPNKEIINHYWDDYEYNRLPYRRGVIFAFYLDNKIQHDSHGEKSLDDLMIEFKEHAVNDNEKITHKHFLKIANKNLTEDLTPFFVKHIENGEFFDLQKIFKDFHYEFNPTGNVFDLGFTFVDDNEKNIRDININSNAYKAGLRKGDRIVGQSYNFGNPNYEATFKVLKGSKKVSFKFFPSKIAQIPSLLDNLNNKKKISSLK